MLPPALARLLSGGLVPAAAIALFAVVSWSPAEACRDLEWDFRLGHNAHSHPRAEKKGCEVAFAVEVPSDHAELGNTFFAVELSYTDHGGSGGTPPLTGRDGIRFFVR
jgi:hypothetical protein